jgi:hypothetical protein
MKTHKALLSRLTLPHCDFRGNSLANCVLLNVDAIIGETRRANYDPRLAPSGPDDVEVFAGDNWQPTKRRKRVRCHVSGGLAPDLEQGAFVTPADRL